MNEIKGFVGTMRPQKEFIPSYMMYRRMHL